VTGARRAAALARKDLLLEWRGRETITAMGVFALLVVLLLGFVLGSEPARAPAILWVALGFAAMLGVARPTQMEVEQQALETLLLYPGSREHIYWGKWAALSAFLTALLAVLLPMLGLLFNLDLWTRLPALLGVGLLGIVGLAAVGTLFAALIIHVRGRELLMPLLLLPVVLPVILAGVRLTETVLTGTSGGRIWLGLLAAFDLVLLLVAPILFEVVMEEA
jgi:heme exporter protein B